MYKFYSRPRKNSTRYLPLLLATTGFFAFSSLLFSTKIYYGTDRVFNQGLRIHLSESSPAFAALEESAEPHLQWIPQAVVTVALSAGSGTIETLVAEKSEEHRLEMAKIVEVQLKNEMERKRLAEIAAQQAAKIQAAQLAQARLAIKAARLKMYTPPTDRVIQKAEAARPSDRFQEMAAQAHQVAHNVRTIRLSELNMQREELIREMLLPMVVSGADAAPETVQLAANHEPEHYLVTATQSHPNKALIPQQPIIPVNSQPPQAPVDSGINHQVVGDAIRQGFAGAASLNGNPSQEGVASIAAAEVSGQQLIISGGLEFSGGLALTNQSDRLVVYRELEEQTLEAGQVWMKSGQYEILVDQPKGELVAELRSASGDIIGRGRYDLETLPPVRQYRMDNITLKIRPIFQGLSGRVMSFYDSQSQIQPIPGSRIKIGGTAFETVSLKDGSFNEPNLVEGSTVVVHAQREGHWGTVALAATGLPSNLTLFQDKALAAFEELSEYGLKNGTDPAIVWGRVTSDGRPVEGATVEFLTSEQVIQPVYFNAMMIPDPTLSETSSNGLYAFFPVQPGTHAVQASFRGLKSESVVFPAEAKAASSIDLDVMMNMKADVRVFDAFHTTVSLPAHISHLDHMTGFDIGPSGHGEYKYMRGNGLLFLDIDAGHGYDVTRLSLTRDRRFFYAPMLRMGWLDAIRGQRRINQEIHSGSIVGFVQGDQPYQVGLDPSQNSVNTKIVYFSPRGEYLDQAYGIPGGGFVVFNAPEGLQTIAIAPNGTTKALNLTVLVDPNVVSVINHWFR